MNTEPEYVRPWLRVTTPAGVFEVRKRKRVMELDYGALTPARPEATALFPNEETTRFDRVIHCWTFDKLTEYLKVIR